MHAFHFLVEDHGPFYGAVSGWVSDIGELALVGAVLGAIRVHNCHVKGCLRIGHHLVEGTPYKVCRIHHPDVPAGGATVEHIVAAHRKAHR